MMKYSIAIVLSLCVISCAAENFHTPPQGYQNDFDISQSLIRGLNEFSVFQCEMAALPDLQNAFWIRHELHFKYPIVCTVIDGEISLITSIGSENYNVNVFMRDYEYEQMGWLKLRQKETYWIYEVLGVEKIRFDFVLDTRDFRIEQRKFIPDILAAMIYELNEALFENPSQWPEHEFFELEQCVSKTKSIQYEMLNASDSDIQASGKKTFPFTFCQNCNQALGVEDLSQMLRKDDSKDFWMPILKLSFPFFPEEFLLRFKPGDELIYSSFLKRCRRDAASNLVQRDAPNYSALSSDNIDDYCECSYDYLKGNKNITIEGLTEVGGVALEEMNSNCLRFFTNEIQRNPETDFSLNCQHKQAIPIIIRGDDAYLVKVRIGGIERYITIDTGAAITTISGRWASKPEIRRELKKTSNKIQLETASGEILIQDVFELSSLSIGNCEIESVPIVILDEGQSLLGSDVLKLFTSATLDFKDGLLILEP